MRDGEDAKATAPQTAAQTLNEELTDPSWQCTKPPRTMWACTYGIDHWIPANHVDRLNAKLVTAWLLSSVEPLNR